MGLALALLGSAACDIASHVVDDPRTHDASASPTPDGSVGPATDAALDADLPAPIPDAGAPEPDAAPPAPDAGEPVSEEPEYAALFDVTQLPRFDITLSEEAILALGVDPDTYQEGTLEHDGKVYEQVGVRLKGRASFQGFDGKPAFKIKLDEFVKGQDLLGLERLTLNNMVQDESMAREVLGFLLLRAAGVPAPRCNHARVYVNGTYYGLYANVQTLDEVFVDEAFPDSKTGNLYDITNDEYFIDFERESSPPAQETRFELETNKKEADISDLTALIDAVSVTPQYRWVSEVEKVLDLDQVLLLGATQAVMADWDGYFGARNNYKAYHELKRDRFVILPWGIDQSLWYEQVDYALDHSESERPRGLIYDRCAVDAGCLARYREKVRVALATFEQLPLESVLDELMVLSSAAIAEDTRKPYSNGEQAIGVEELRAFLRERANYVKVELSAE